MVKEDACPICGSKLSIDHCTYFDLDTGVCKIKRGDKFRVTTWSCSKCGYSTYKKEKIE